MSSTRYAPKGALFAFERYMSSPELREMRGLPATAVAAKAQLSTDQSQRGLLFFIQSLSLRDGGLRRLAREIAAELPGLDEKQTMRLLIDLCTNPKFEVSENPNSNDSIPRNVMLTTALRRFRDRYESRFKAGLVLTSVGQQIVDALDHALGTRRMVVIEGNSGTGKTTATEAWSRTHQGEARFVSLSGITHKTGFFHNVATAVGLAASKRKTVDMQIRVEKFFRKARLMLVIDEAHYLFPQYYQRYRSPELVDWVNTALVNQGVPVALICTDQFAKLKQRMERRAGWAGEQLEHRIKRYVKLPPTVTEDDLEAVAINLLSKAWDAQEQTWTCSGPRPSKDYVDLVVGYSLTCNLRLPAIADTIAEARYQAQRNGRSVVSAADLQTALFRYRIPSDRALETVHFRRSSCIRASSRVRRICAPAGSQSRE